MKRLARMTLGLAGLAILPVLASAQGKIFLTGHDPDFHAFAGANAVGAQHINQVAINYIMNNPYVGGGATKMLVVESTMSPPGGHVNGVNGVIASGFAAVTDFDLHDASTLHAALGQLGTVYGGLVVCSDFGGVLSQAELDILNADGWMIRNFVNSGGGLYAMAEANGGAHLTPGGGWFGYVPIVASSAAHDENENGYTVTAFGSSLGLNVSDVNGNFSHNVFTSWDSQLNVVDLDSLGNVVSLAGEVNVVPEPATLAVIAMGGLGLVSRLRRK